MPPRPADRKPPPNDLPPGDPPSSAGPAADAGTGESGLAIHDHELLRRIGHGAYGEVWLARNALGGFRAVKIVYRKDFEQNRPFEREFNGIQRFEPISRSHPGLVHILQVGRRQEYFYYVMELADDLQNPKFEIRDPKETRNPKPEEPPGNELVRSAGFGHPSAFDLRAPDLYTPRTLREDLRQTGRLPAARCLEIAQALASALGYLHHQGLVHRDVKPSNIIFAKGLAKLADIGLVTEAGDSQSIVGTEGYLPPEGPGTPQADIYSLGKVLYEISTGQDRRQFPDLPPDLKDWPDRQVVLELNEVVLKACAGEAGQRYPSAKDLLNDLARLQQGRSLKSQRTWQQRLRAARHAGWAATALALAATAGIFLWQTIGPQFPRGVPPVNEDGTAGTRNPKAAEAYNLGLPGLRRGTSEGFLKAREAFNDAITADPKFVAAYARLFEVYLMSEDHSIPFIDGKSNKLNELSVTLMKLAPTNAESHAALAIVRFLNEWKWDEAEREFKHALELDPNCRMALTYYGYFLTRQRRDKVARPLLERARALAPTAPLIAKLLGHCEFVARRYEAALPFYESASEHEPSYPSGHYWAGRVYVALTNYPQALVEMERYELKQGLQPYRYEEYRKVLETAGPSGFWTNWLADIQQDGEGRTGTPLLAYTKAMAYARLRDTQPALAWLEKAFNEHDSMEHLLVDEVWDDYRREPRFKAVLKNIGLEPWHR
jgi:serine/threonine protein kinase